MRLAAYMDMVSHNEEAPRGHLLLVALDGLQRIVTVAANALVNRQQEEVPVVSVANKPMLIEQTCGHRRF